MHLLSLFIFTEFVNISAGELIVEFPSTRLRMGSKMKMADCRNPPVKIKCQALATQQEDLYLIAMVNLDVPSMEKPLQRWGEVHFFCPVKWVEKIHKSTFNTNYQLSNFWALRKQTKQNYYLGTYKNQIYLHLICNMHYLGTCVYCTYVVLLAKQSRRSFTNDHIYSSVLSVLKKIYK